MNNKKYLIVLVLKILETYTDSSHPITQKKIVEYIGGVYSCDRKTVGRDIKFLKEVGYPIVKTTQGFYMDKKVFSVADLDFIKEAIMSCESKSYEERVAMCNKLGIILNKHYVR